ncbi:class 1b ribonucleoside-diphosphate reductase subunit alpha [Sporolactobacillus shoreicorticis]|uniref:Ribonucleoside-diphosphate reductase n=1 Tax=Sporolactobacillus shoreicorticis TaxID=1923877 RepID=A0ABW5SAY3_9BACL|nr:class 1b ribonucleoside-diphosphate reductase subunit alpha [Sporolactobacillus shoreicorticis]MCO7127293.1 class 1b ribonucleoside-diphosphate reductase subunit alpha [Sporolactobacillus shoreicorticis]
MPNEAIKSKSYTELNNEVLTRGDDGFYRLDKDREAIEVYMEEVRAKTIPFSSILDRLHYLVNEHYYYDVFAAYSDAQIEQLHRMAADYNFQFKSYMAVSKFYRDYAMKTNDKSHYLENYDERVTIVSLFLARGNYDLAVRLTRAMMEQRYQPATPTFLNAGKARRGEMVSCFLIEADDSLNSINYIESTSQQLSKIGGGVALNLSKIRARGEAIKGVEGVAKGVVPVARKLQLGFSYADQLGQRPGAGAAYLNIFHWDAPEFLDTKKENADEDIRLSTLSIGLIVPGKFFELAEAGKPFYMFAPYTVFKEYGRHLDDMNMDEMYDKLVANSAVKKKRADTREFLNLIAQMQMQSGYPYIFYKDNANKNHPLHRLGDIKMSNLCTEIFQLQETSTINDYDVPDDIRRDVSCILGSLNIVNVMETGKIRDSVHAGIEALTQVSEMTEIANAPGVSLANRELHSVGLGAMNLNGYLAKNQLAYESVEARDFARTFFSLVNFYSIEESMLIAKERGKTFKGFEKSDYADGTYFAKYEHEFFGPKTEKVAVLFKGIHIPTTAEWTELKKKVAQYGLYNAYRLAVAPTQSISYVQNATSSVMPVVNVIERRKYGNSETIYPMPFLSPQTMWYYKSAYQTNQFRVIDMIAEIQAHVDQGISTILYVDSMTSTRQLARLYVYAHKKGLKSLYYTRTQLLSPEECTACSV